MKILNRKAFSVIEYAMLLVIIISAFLMLRPYIQRGIFGMWGQSGQSMAYGRQYDSQKSIECSYDDQVNKWYDRNCFEAKEQNCAIGNSDCYEQSAVAPCVVSGSACDNLNNASK